MEPSPPSGIPGYTNVAVTEPPLKLVLLEGEAGQDMVMDHLGVEVESTMDNQGLVNAAWLQRSWARTANHVCMATPSSGNPTLVFEGLVAETVHFDDLLMLVRHAGAGLATNSGPAGAGVAFLH